MLRVEPADLALARELILEYAVATGVDLSFQGFAEEIEHLDSHYEIIFLARWNAEPAGCVALRRIDATTSEMKRLYVRAAFRGKDVGRALALRVIEEARARGFTRMLLDTLPTMTTAMKLYQSLGFVDIPPYRYNPVEGTRYMQLIW
ncbi:MAG TPA: GNAT family N-acetyltransferase [Thermoanaerobaculia bacterium]|jgi:ribosomal protein S18 acetylase RimI-like enzyme|nr:GNAT family N-acetyltransferase [Thermoanaerobaculia bacterium]